MCFSHLNKKALLGLGALAIALFLLRPVWIGAALPLLLLAVGPLGMLFIRRGRRDGRRNARGDTDPTDTTADATATREGELTSKISSLQDELRTLKAAQAREASLPTRTPWEQRRGRDLGSDASGANTDH